MVIPRVSEPPIHGTGSDSKVRDVQQTSIYLSRPGVSSVRKPDGVRRAPHHPLDS